MQKIYESKLNGWNESAERVYVYALENDEEYFELCALSHREMCDKFDVFDEFDHEVLPGAVYKTYSFHLSSTHVFMCEQVAYNV